MPGGRLRPAGATRLLSLEQVPDPGNPSFQGRVVEQAAHPAASGGRTVEPVTEEDF
jgi:hypothetical protein